MVCAPGNGGIAQIARCVPVDLKDLDSMIRVAEAERPDLTIVGPELPLSLGIVDALQRARSARLWANPRRGHAGNQQGLRQAISAAPQHSHRQLRRLHHRRRDGKGCRQYSIRLSWSRPTAWLRARACSSASRARTAIEAAQGLFSGALLGEAERQVVVEEFLEGDEISFLCLS